MIEEIKKRIEKEDVFFKHNNFHIIEASKDKVILKANITNNSLNAYGIIHGGTMFSLGDEAMGVLAFLTGRKAVTLNASINYLKPGKGSFITCTAELVKSGSKTAYARAYLYNEKEELIALMDGTYFYIDE